MREIVELQDERGLQTRDLRRLQLWCDRIQGSLRFEGRGNWHAVSDS